MNPAMLEKQLQAIVVAEAKRCGWEVYFTWKSYHSPKGFPDLVLANPPRLVFAELKSRKKKLEPNQEKWRDILLACGQEWYLWYEEDLEDIYNLLIGGVGFAKDANDRIP